MPRKVVRSLEALREQYGEDWPPPVRLSGGYLHLHYIQNMASWRWAVVINHTENMCGTARCMILKVRSEVAGVECEHEWRGPVWGEMICRNCEDVRMFEIKIQ